MNTANDNSIPQVSDSYAIRAGENACRGIARNADGTWTALTLTQSKTFATRNGAALWFARRAGVTIENVNRRGAASTLVRMGDRQVELVGRVGLGEATANALYQWAKSM